MNNLCGLAVYACYYFEVTIQHPHRSESKRSSLWAVRGAPRLARPLHIVRIRPASKLAGTNFDNMQGVLNNYILRSMADEWKERSQNIDAL